MTIRYAVFPGGVNLISIPFVSLLAVTGILVKQIILLLYVCFVLVH